MAEVLCLSELKLAAVEYCELLRSYLSPVFMQQFLAINKIGFWLPSIILFSIASPSNKVVTRDVATRAEALRKIGELHSSRLSNILQQDNSEETNVVSEIVRRSKVVNPSRNSVGRPRPPWVTNQSARLH